MSGESAGGHATRTLVVWCPDWPLVAHGIGPHEPAVVVRANRVLACTAAARAEGVATGLRRREAQGRCPDVQVVEHDPAEAARAFEAVAAAVEAFTPHVEISRPGTCALPTKGPARYFGGDERLAGRIREAVDTVLGGLAGARGAEGGCDPAVRCRVGIADGPFTAAQAARRELVVAPGTSAEFLAPLPVGLLDEPELTDLLVRLGLTSLGSFAALATADVVARFGPVGLVAHRRARGLDDRALNTRTPPPELAAEVHLDPPADRVDTAAFAAKAMADDCCARLAALGLVFTCIRIDAETEHGEHLSRVWRHHGSFTPGAVADRVRWQLEGWLAGQARCGCAVTPGAPICPGGPDCPDPAGGTTGGLVMLRVTPDDVITDDGRQSGFWGGVTEADERAARGLARVQGLLGPGAVLTAVASGGRGPGEQVTLVPWGDPRVPRRPAPPAPDAGPQARSRRRARTAPASPTRTSGRAPAATELPVWPGRLPAPFPALVPAVPLPVALVDASGAAVGVTGRSAITAAPGRVSVDGAAWSTIRAWAGPWTADERWWDPPSHRRLARVQIVTTDGEAHLLLLEHGRWWLEATYD